MADTTHYVSGMERARRRSESLERQHRFLEKSFGRVRLESTRTSQAMQRMNGLTGRQTQAMQQLVFGVEDAASVYGTSGLAGSLRAAGNNLTFVAASLGGVQAVLLTTAAVITGQAVLSWLKLSESTNKAKKELDDYKQSLNGLQSATGARAQFQGNLAAAGSSKDAQGMLRASQQQLAVINAKREELKQARDLLVKQDNNRIKDHNRGSRSILDHFSGGPQAQNTGKIQEIGERIAKLNADARAEAQKQADIQKRITDLKKEESGIRREQARVENSMRNSDIRHAKQMAEHNKRMDRIANVRGALEGENQHIANIRQTIRDKIAAFRERQNNDPAFAGPSAIGRGSFDDLNSARLAKVRGIVRGSQSKPELTQLKKIASSATERRNLLQRMLEKLERQAEFMAPVGAFDE